LQQLGNSECLRAKGQGIVLDFMPFFRRIIIFNSGVAVSALAFQVGVLYPWHHVLSDQLHDLKKEVKELKQTVKFQSVELAKAQGTQEGKK